MKPLFSICNIARNESKTLPKLAGSLAEFLQRGGEWLIVDTGSTDNTVEVARSLGATVHEVGDRFLTTLDAKTAKEINKKFVVEGEDLIVKKGDKIFDFASARNYAASLCENDMVAMPDCDEVYTKLDLDTIDKMISGGASQFEYEFVFAHDANGEPLIQFKHSKFYDRRKAKWVGVVHEVLSGETTRHYLSTQIVKLEHWQNPETNRNGYLIGLAFDCYQNPENDRNSHYLARELMYKGRYRSAIQEFKRHIVMNKWHTERAQSISYIGDCLQYLGEDKEALGWYTRSFDLEPNRRYPLIRLAEYYYARKGYRQAQVYAEACLSIGMTNYYSNNAEHYRDLPHKILYWAYWWLGDKEKSKYHFEKAVEFAPQNSKYINDKKFYESPKPEDNLIKI